MPPDPFDPASLAEAGANAIEHYARRQDELSRIGFTAGAEIVTLALAAELVDPSPAYVTED